MSKVNKEKPKFAIEDLEVNEVSVVDKPANKRKFILVKQADGEFSTDLQELLMADVQKNADQATLGDVLGLTEGQTEKPQTEQAAGAEEQQAGETVTVEKSVQDLLDALVKAKKRLDENEGESSDDTPFIEVAKNASILAQSANGCSLGIDTTAPAGQLAEAISLLTQAAHSVQKSEDKKLNQDQADFLATAASAIVKALDVATAETDSWIQKGKNLAQVLNREIDKKTSSRTERAELVRKLGESAGIATSTVGQILRAQIDCPPKKRLDSFASTLGVSSGTIVDAARRDGCTIEKSEEELPEDIFIEPSFRLFKSAEESDDPEVVLQSGDVTKIAKLSTIKSTIAKLQGVVKDVEGDPVTEQKQETQNQSPDIEAIVKATVKEVVKEALAKGLVDGFTELEKRIDSKLEGVTKSFGEVKERVEKMENANPGSNADPDANPAEPVEKNADPLGWGGVLGL